MANRFWTGAVGSGTGTWDGATTTNWSTTSGGAGGASVPTTSDTAVFDSNSGTGTVTVNTGNACGALICDGSIGTGAYSGHLVIGTSSAVNVTNAGAASWILSATMTCTVLPQKMGAGTLTIKTNGVVMGGIFVNGGTVILSDATTCITTGTVTLNQGTLNTNGQTCVWGTFSSSNTLTRTLTLGTSSITITAGGASWNIGNGSGFTPSLASSTITFTAAVATSPAFNSFTYGTIILNTPLLTTLGGSPTLTCGTLTYAPPSGLGNALVMSNGGITVTGTFTVSGPVAPNRVLIQSGTVGTAKTISAAVVSITGADFQDVTAAGVGNWTIADAGDCFGNTGITFPAPQSNYYKAAGAANWSTAGNWFLATNGGGGAGRVPLPQDTALFDANSGTSTCTFQTPRIGSLDLTGWTGGILGSTSINCYGNLIGSPGVATTTQGGTGYTLCGRGSFSVKSALPGLLNGGITFLGVTVNAPGGTYTLLDNVSTAPTRAVSVIAGTLDAATNNVNITTGHITLTGAATRQLNMGSGTWTLVITGHVVDITVAGLTLNASASTIVVSDTTATAKLFANTAGFTFGTLQIADGLGTFTISASATFAAIICQSTALIIAAGATITITTAGGWQVNGVNNGYQYLPGIAGNYCSTPSATPLDITGDIDIRCKVSLANWSTPTAESFVSKYGNTLAHDCYRLRINTTGLLIFECGNGTASTAASATVGTGLVAGAVAWVRVTWVASTGLTTFYQSPNGSTWTQVGATRTAAGVSSILVDDTVSLAIGGDADGANGMLNGSLYRAQVYNGIAGTLVFDADFTQKPFGANSFTENANGATVTINGAVAQMGDGRASINSSSAGVPVTISVASGSVTSVYTTIQDSTATGGATFTAWNSVQVSGDTGWTFSTITGGGSIDVEATATGGPQSAATGTVSLSASATGTVPGTATGAVSIVATGTGKVTGTTTGTLTVTATATGAVRATAGATIVFVGGAVGHATIAAIPGSVGVTAYPVSTVGVAASPVTTVGVSTEPVTSVGVE